MMISLFALAPSAFAGELKTLKLRSLNAVEEVKNSYNHKKDILNKINDFIGDDIDLSLFDKRKPGWSVYAKVSKVSRLGVRYRF
jgi:hypothetical protein